MENVAPPLSLEAPELAPPSSQTAANDVAEINTTLRLVRTEISDLLALLGKIKAGATTLSDAAAYVQKSVTDVNKLIVTLRTKSTEDRIRHVANVWEEMLVSQVLVNPSSAASTQQFLQQLALLEEQAKEIILCVGLITIPERLNDWLDLAPTGHYLPFHLIFQDELPDIADRQKVLNTIAWAESGVDCGIVNPATGLVYRFDPKLSARIWSLVQVLLLTFATATLVWALGTYAGTEPKPYLSWWLAIVTGLVVHVGIAGVKRTQTTGLPAIVPVNDLLKHVSARKSDIAVKLFSSLVGLFALVSASSPNTITLMSAFLVGYSLDSVLAVFGASLDERAAALVSSLKTQMTPKTD